MRLQQVFALAFVFAPLLASGCVTPDEPGAPVAAFDPAVTLVGQLTPASGGFRLNATLHNGGSTTYALPYCQWDDGWHSFLVGERGERLAAGPSGFVDCFAPREANPNPFPPGATRRVERFWAGGRTPSEPSYAGVLPGNYTWILAMGNRSVSFPLRWELPAEARATPSRYDSSLVLAGSATRHDGAVLLHLVAMNNGTQDVRYTETTCTGGPYVGGYLGTQGLQIFAAGGPYNATLGTRQIFLEPTPKVTGRCPGAWRHLAPGESAARDLWWNGTRWQDEAHGFVPVTPGVYEVKMGWFPYADNRSFELTLHFTIGW